MEKPTFEEFISNLPQDLDRSSSSSCSSIKSEELLKNKNKFNKNNSSSDSECLDYSIKDSSDNNSLMNDSVNNLNKAQRILSFDEENEENVCCKKKVTN